MIEQSMEKARILELAAKANGGLVYIPDLGWIFEDANGNRGSWWNPYESDSDAFKLLVNLKLTITYSEYKGIMFVNVEAENRKGAYEVFQHPDDKVPRDKRAIIREAIVKTAAILGMS